MVSSLAQLWISVSGAGQIALGARIEYGAPARGGYAETGSSA